MEEETQVTEEVKPEEKIQETGETEEEKTR